MATIDEFHSIQDLITKIGEKADELSWPELTDCAVEAYNRYEKEESYEKMFFECHQFLMRLWLRVKDLDSKRPFDRVVRLHEEYVVYGYSIKLFLFARQHIEAVNLLDNDKIEFDKDKLSDAAIASFDKKIEEE